MLKLCAFVLWYGSQLSVVKESCQQGEALAGFRWKANPFNEYRFQPSLATVAAAGLLLCMSSGALRPQQSSSGIVLKNPKSLSQWYSCIAACLVNIYISMCILSVNFWDETSFWLTHVAKDSVKNWTYEADFQKATPRRRRSCMQLQQFWNHYVGWQYKNGKQQQQLRKSVHPCLLAAVIFLSTFLWTVSRSKTMARFHAT